MNLFNYQRWIMKPDDTISLAKKMAAAGKPFRLLTLYEFGTGSKKDADKKAAAPTQKR